MMFSQALQYPFQGKGWFQRILILALIQLIPIVGQLILLGYGLDIVRAVYAGKIGLPPLRWRQALGDGLLFLVAGLGYLLPIILTVAIVGASYAGSKSFGNTGLLALLLSIGLPLLLLMIRTVFMRRASSSNVQRTQTRRISPRTLLTGLLPIVATVAVILILRTLISQSGISTGKPNRLSILLFVVFALLLFLIGTVLYVGGVRYATEKKGLLAPMTNAKLLLKNRTLTGTLLLNVILLAVITVIATSIGLVLFILPGLFVFVICSLALWYMFASYSISVGINTPSLTFVKSVASIS